MRLQQFCLACISFDLRCSGAGLGDLLTECREAPNAYPKSQFEYVLLVYLLCNWGESVEMNGTKIRFETFMVSKKAA